MRLVDYGKWYAIMFAETPSKQILTKSLKLVRSAIKQGDVKIKLFSRGALIKFRYISSREHYIEVFKNNYSAYIQSFIMGAPNKKVSYRKVVNNYGVTLRNRKYGCR